MDEPWVVERAKERTRTLSPLGKCSLVIAHRSSTIVATGKILVTDEGKLVDQGTHKELVAAAGLCSRLHETKSEGAPSSLS